MEDTRLGLGEGSGVPYIPEVKKEEGGQTPPPSSTVDKEESELGSLLQQESSQSLDKKTKRSMHEQHMMQKVEGSYEEKEKEGESTSPVKKKSRSLTEGENISASGDFNPEPILEKLANCFESKAKELIEPLKEKISSGKIQTEAHLAKEIFIIINNRFKEGNAVTSEEITKMYALLFEEPLGKYSEEEVSGTQSFVAPRSAYIVKSLYGCLQAINSYGSYDKALEAAITHISSKPDPENSEKYAAGISMLIGQPGARDELEVMTKGEDVELASIATKILQSYEAYTQDLSLWQTQLKAIPLVLAKDALGGKNFNETYVLGDGTGKIQWIFKPAIKGGESSVNDSHMPIRELAASLVNDHKQFPVAKTILIELNGWLGSAQFFVEDAKGLEDVKQHTISEKELQSLAIFDILFGNTDRHEDNILFQELQHNMFLPIGIDHDRCMQGLTHEALKIKYQHLPPIRKQFQVNLRELVLEETVDRYANIMQDLGISRRAIDWMGTGAQIIRNAIDEGLTVQGTIEKANQVWQEKFLS